MQNSKADVTTLPGASPPTSEKTWVDELDELLLHAAEMSARHDVPQEVFMAAAWNAYLTARPGLREKLEERELRSQLKKLRKQGLIAVA